MKPVDTDKARPTGSRSSFASDDRIQRFQRADKILAILRDHCRPEQCEALEIGTGSGLISSRLGGSFKSLTSVDVSDQRTVREGYRFIQVEDERLPFCDGFFDVVISNQVIEHVWVPELHVREMARVLRPSGIGYLATPNRFALIEPHYRLPLLSWGSTRIADRYLRWARGRTWDVNAHSFRQLIKIVEKEFSWRDALPLVAANPVDYHLTYSKLKARLLASLPGGFWDSRINLLLPSFILILSKKTGT